MKLLGLFVDPGIDLLLLQGEFPSFPSLFFGLLKIGFVCEFDFELDLCSFPCLLLVDLERSVFLGLFSFDLK